MAKHLSDHRETRILAGHQAIAQDLRVLGDDPGRPQAQDLVEVESGSDQRGRSWNACNVDAAILICFEQSVVERNEFNLVAKEVQRGLMGPGPLRANVPYPLDRGDVDRWRWLNCWFISSARSIDNASEHGARERKYSIDPREASGPTRSSQLDLICPDSF